MWYELEGPKNKRVSDVLIAEDLHPWDISKFTPILWHNPWAKKPFLYKLWKLFQYILDMENNILKEIQGQQPWKLFGLSPDWPYNLYDK